MERLCYCSRSFVRDCASLCRSRNVSQIPNRACLRWSGVIRTCGKRSLALAMETCVEHWIGSSYSHTWNNLLHFTNIERVEVRAWECGADTAERFGWSARQNYGASGVQFVTSVETIQGIHMPWQTCARTPSTGRDDTTTSP